MPYLRPVLLEDVNSIKLQTRKPVFCACQWSSDQGGEAQLYALLQLMRNLKAMFCDVRTLTDLAVIEVAQDGLPLDIDTGIAELPVTLLLQSSQSSLKPVASTCMRVASE